MESERLFLMFFHITAWGVPFVITVVAYFFNGVQLLADLETGYKCWIRNEKTWKAMCIWTTITGEGWGHHDIHHHDCVLPTGQAAHKKRGIQKNFNKVKKI